MTGNNALLYECFSGIAGDMHIGALVDVGVPHDHLKSELSKLRIDDEFSLDFSHQIKMGIRGTRAQVECTSKSHHHHRRLNHINEIIDRSEFSEDVSSLAKRIFRSLAEAEAKVHGIGVNEVHFHEVGATDAIVDIVGAAIGINYLRPTDVLCGPVELGSGVVACEHGIMPVPAPATAELLRDFETTRGGVKGEATTPTGAAILATLIEDPRRSSSFVAQRIGYGVGMKDFERPNVLRVSTGSLTDVIASDDSVEIECNIDDMSPEAFEPLIDRLFDSGALDVFLTPIVMKKSRPGTKVSILANAADQMELINRLFQSSTTIGARIHSISKVKLPRHEQVVETRFGEIPVKVVQLPDGGMRWKSEYDVVSRIAQESGEDYLRVKKDIDADVDEQLAK